MGKCRTAASGRRKALHRGGKEPIMHRKFMLGLVALLFLGAASAAAAEELVKLETRPGVTQAFWVMTPPGPPVASVILFTGGPGLLFSNRKPVLNSKNFLIRSRDKFAAAGFLVVSVDGPSDHLEGLDDDFRTSAEHARDIAAVIAYVRQKAPVPVWLIGTSRGTTSAASIAARLKSGGADGLVLTSSIVASNGRLAPVQSNVDVAAITLPTLFVHNKDDACRATPFSAVPALMAKFTHAPRKELIAVSGGSPPQSDPCEALSRHGYIGIEDEVVGKIAAWIKSS
jgi:pimeloyl-ACP methyl ester carboxylesterase